MKYLVAATMAALVACAPLATLARQTPQQQTQQKQAPEQMQPPPPDQNQVPLQTIGKVGATNYAWTNGESWFSLSDESRIALVVGIEQGVVLSVRENWDDVPKAARQTMSKTAERATMNGVPFNRMADLINEFYADPPNLQIPVVDAYLYVVMKLKSASAVELQDALTKLRKTYKIPEVLGPPGKQ